MNLLPPVFKRQLASYLSAPATYLSIALFLVLSALLGLHTSPLLERSSSDLQGFFQWHPWLYLLLIPALSTQLWADENETGFGDFMKTLPVRPAELVIGKFLAAWVVAGLALLLTFPIVTVVNLLGTADNAVIASQFLSSWLLAGSYLSVGVFICALTRQRLAIFILTLSLLLLASGVSSVLDALERQAPIWIIDSLTSLSPLLRFGLIDHGTLTFQDCAYFISMIIAFLAATTAILNYKNS
ncbi:MULTISPECIES: ABC-2 transporter permease [unclassified Pseudomonas]|uniref:ABC-2 transporter permease n=1 Tax=unclassified Pseudomonas TaxID=196821 RepID=UPI0023E367A9|nr:ABC transporter permease [Pseudomonas sp. D3]WET12399.1 ABC transporter permease [Pseudomonas sp. D3]